MEYDVFISCKSEDYPFAREVYQYLKRQNYNVFFADTELRKNGDSEYGKIIDKALCSATHMIVISTKPEYICSSYVENEWRVFLEEKRSGRKKGNITTIVNFPIEFLPIGLRHFQSFDINSYNSIVDYLPHETNDIFDEEGIEIVTCPTCDSADVENDGTGKLQYKCNECGNVWGHINSKKCPNCGTNDVEYYGKMGSFGYNYECNTCGEKWYSNCPLKY